MKIIKLLRIGRRSKFNIFKNEEFHFCHICVTILSQGLNSRFFEKKTRVIFGEFINLKLL